MTTDNRTNEQAYEGLKDRFQEELDLGGDAGSLVASLRSWIEDEPEMAAALVAAAGAAPQAENMPRGTDFFVAARVERATHAKRGWPVEHDQKQGVDHLLRLALDYLANEKPVKAGSLIMAARELLAGGECVPGCRHECGECRLGLGKHLTCDPKCQLHPVLPSSTVNEEALAEVIARHRVTAGRPGLPIECLCNWRSSLGDESHAAHVARAVVAALGGESR